MCIFTHREQKANSWPLTGMTTAQTSDRDTRRSGSHLHVRSAPGLSLTQHVQELQDEFLDILKSIVTRLEGRVDLPLDLQEKEKESDKEKVEESDLFKKMYLHSEPAQVCDDRHVSEHDTHIHPGPKVLKLSQPPGHMDHTRFHRKNANCISSFC